MKNNNEVKTSIFYRFRQYINRSFHDKRVANGLYVSVVSVIFIALVVVINLIVSKADITGDLTSNNQYSMSKDTKEYLKKLKEDIIIYYFTEPSGKDDSVFELVKKYDSESKHIKVIEKDPVQYPTLYSKFSGSDTSTDTSSSSNNSVCVVRKDNEEEYKFIPYSSLVVTDIDYTTYQQSVTGVDVEGQVTSAINYLTSDISKKFYYVTGHNESEAFSSAIEELFTKQNFISESIALHTTGEVPKDCDLLVILAPQSDYLENEIKAVKEYLNKGKAVMVLTGYINDSLPNLNKLLKEYGLINNEKLVIDKDSARTAVQSPTILYPIIEDHEITKDFNNAYVAINAATGFTLAENKDETLNVSTLLKTSDRGYLVSSTDSLNSVNSSNSKKGQYILGAAVTKTLDNNKEARLVAFSASSTFDVNSQIDTSSYMNGDLIMNSIYWACNIDSAAAISIPSKTFENIPVTMQGADVVLLTVTFLILIPVIILVFGFVVWVRRRRK